MPSLLAANETLSEFFSLAYERGAQYAGEGFVDEVDSDLNERIYRHSASGIKVWQDALHMAGSAADKVTLFYYVDAESFASITYVPRMIDEVSLLFGEGIFASTKSPGEFGTREAVLWNNYWTQLQEDDAAGCSRDDPRHRLKQWASFTDYCIPVLAAKGEALEAQWNEQVQKSRDVWAVRLSDAKQRGYASRECLLQYRGQRCRQCQAKLGSDHPETLSAKNSVARSLALIGNLAEAGDLFSEVLSGRERLLGLEHQDTLSVKNNFAYSVGERGDLVESERLLLEVLTSSERVLGSNHPDTLRVKRNIGRIRRKRNNIQPEELKAEVCEEVSETRQKARACEVQ